jgi:hypothetical protein
MGSKDGRASGRYETQMPRDLPLALVLFVLAWATVARAVLVFAQKLPPTCDSCGRRFERRHLGEPVCRCHA